MTVDAPTRPFELPAKIQAGPISDGGRLTLEQRLDRVWEGLSAAGAAPCPLCGGRMLREIDAAHCTGCGSTLS